MLLLFSLKHFFEISTKILNAFSFLSEHGTLFTGTFQPYRDKSVIYSKSFKRAQLSKQVHTALKESSFFAGKYTVFVFMM